MANGQGSHWLIESPIMFHLCVTHLPEIFVNFVLDIFMLLAFIQSADNLFHSFIVLCENEYFLISNLHLPFTNVTSCPLVLLSFLRGKKIFLSVFSFNI